MIEGIFDHHIRANVFDGAREVPYKIYVIVGNRDVGLKMKHIQQKLLIHDLFVDNAFINSVSLQRRRHHLAYFCDLVFQQNQTTSHNR